MALTSRSGLPPMSRAPLLWALAYVVLAGVVLFTIPWSLGDTYSHLVTPALSSWPDAIVSAFTGLEFRPAFALGIKTFYEVVGVWLQFYQALALLQFAALLALVVWSCRPSGLSRGVAACIAISCIAGLHTSRILFGFWPLNHYSAVMVCVLLAIALALDARSRSIDWVFGPLALVAMLGIEVGGLVVPVAVALWWFGAPGLSRRGVAWVLLAAVLYLTIRGAFGEQPREFPLYVDSGLGFSALDISALRARFGDSPWLFWIYNVIAAFLTTVASEPRDGVYSFVESLLARDMETWQWFHVGSSLLTTGVIAVGLAWSRPWKERDRLLVVGGCALLVFGSALGFLYARDRLGLAGGVGYALLLYVACASLLENAPLAGWRRRMVAGVLAMVAAAWVVRSGETWFQLRDTAWEFRLEWTERWEELGARQEQTELLKQLRAAALASTPADPRHDPAWTYRLFERRLRRLPPAP
jgi:hypothetical protein